MNGMARGRVLALLGLGALLGCPVDPPSPAASLPKAICFRTAEDARQYVIARMLASPPRPEVTNPYTATYTRTHTTVNGTKTHFFLVDTPERELELAQGFEAHGFFREAVCHYTNLAVYYPDTPQGNSARERAAACREQTVLGLVHPLSLVLEDTGGRRFVPIRKLPPESNAESLKRPHLPVEAPFQIQLRSVGFVDDAGRIVIGHVVGSIEGFAREGTADAAREYFRVSRDARTLFEADAIAKARRINEDSERTAAESYLYLGQVDEGKCHLESSGETVADPLENEEDLAKIAGDPKHPLRLDALWTLKKNYNPRFVLTTESSVTTTERFELDLNAHAIDRMTFHLARVTDPVPEEESKIEKWLTSAATAPPYQETVEVVPGNQTVRLPLREPGTYRVTAQAEGLSCVFTAMRTDASLELLAFPGKQTLTLSGEGFTVSSNGKVLGTTDAQGYMVPRTVISQRICDQHRSCCSGCESCAHHHGKDRLATNTPQVFVSGRGQFFHASAEVDLSPFNGIKMPSAAPILLVYTDRPVYKAGDTMRFRGIVRIPKRPLHRTDPSQLAAAPEREIELSISCDDSTLLRQTYVTGEFGTFSGEFTLPLSAYRAEYQISAEYSGAKVAQPFEVMDYRKSDYSIVLTPDAKGFRIRAGYVWGAPVPGTTLRCLVNKKKVAVRGNHVPAAHGQRVIVELMRGKESLARKSVRFRAPTTTQPDETPVPEPEDPPTAAAAPKPSDVFTPAAPEPPAFTVSTTKSLYGRGEMIDVELRGPWDSAQATVVVGDLQLYDLRRVKIVDGTGRVTIPARGIHDPGTSIFAVCNGLQARRDILVRAEQMPLEIVAPASGKPGEKVSVTLKADPDTVLSLAAVDEAIFMLREDDTPEIYRHFHPRRPAAFVYARFGGFTYAGETHQKENPLSDEAFRKAEKVGEGIVRGDNLYLALKGGGGGRYGSRLGGRRNLVARGGGGSNTEDACLSSMRYLPSLQKADGSWDGRIQTEAGLITTPGTTGLALLSFLGAGYSHLSKDTFGGVCFGDVVRNSLQYLMKNQASDGLIGTENGDWILNHALGALALSEAYGLTGSNLYKDQAQQAITHLAALQSPDGGWHRRDQGKNGEILASTFAVMALKSAEISGLTYSATCAQKAWTYFDIQVDDNGLCGSPATPAKVGGAMVARIFLRKEQDTRTAAAAAWLVTRKASWNRPDFLGWYLASLALFQFDGPAGPRHRSYSTPLKDVLVRHQGGDGSWTIQGESLFHTSLATLSLEVYYRYANVFGTKGGGQSPGLAPAPRVRLYFPDTAFWAPDLRTDDKGLARASFTLPEQITTTRLTARGISKHADAGQAVARIEIKQPFFVKIRCPEFAVLDDEIEIRVEAFNYTNEPLSTIVTLEGRESRTITVPTDRPAGAAWRVRATDLSGLRLRATAHAGDYRDAMERVVPVRRTEREIIRTIRGQSSTGKTFRFTSPPEAQNVVVKVHPRTGNLPKVLDALQYLTAYPYG